jgi:hypothetical protein
MFLERDKVNDEYCICPSYNYAIKAGKKMGTYNIAIEQMHGIGTPEDLNFYLQFLKENNSIPGGPAMRHRQTALRD